MTIATRSTERDDTDGYFASNALTHRATRLTDAALARQSPVQHRMDRVGICSMKDQRRMVDGAPPDPERPPSMTRCVPVMSLARSEHRYITAFATSSGAA